MARWWVRRGENTFGPLEASTIVEALRDGRIEPGDLACKEGGRDWLLVSAVPDVAEMFAPKRSQPPPEQDPWTEAAWMIGDLDGEILDGPVSLEQVKQGVARGDISPGALLARVGSSAWQPMQDIFEEEMKTGVRANPWLLAQEQRTQSPQAPRAPQPPVQPRASAPPLPLARPSSAPRPPTKPPGPPPRRATQMIMQPPVQTRTPAPPRAEPRTLTEPPPGSPTQPRSPTQPPMQRAPSTPPRVAPAVAPPAVAPPAMAPPQRPLPARRRTLLEGAQVPSSSEMTLNPGDGLEWWVSRDGNPVGPLSTEELRQALMHGAIDGQTAVCRADQMEWKAAATFDEITGAAGTTRTRPPPLPPRR